MYKKKNAYLTSLIFQIKRYRLKKLENTLCIKEVEKLLDMPEIGDREWEKMPVKHQKIFNDFLTVHIDAYEEVVEELKKKVIE